ncbi:MAG: CBS domain-containing protein [Thermodesulfobacteriota bacterium]
MPHSLPATKLMIPASEWPVVFAEATVRDAIKFLRIVTEEKKLMQGHSTPLVLDRSHRLVGFVHLIDLLKNVRPLCGDTEAPCDLDKATTVVSELTVPFAGTVGPADSILTALDLMMDHRVSLMPVLDNEKLLGIIKLSDVFTTVASLLFDEEIIEEKDILMKRFHL